MCVYKAIAAMAANRVIGRGGRLPWRLPEDLQFFKAVTMGHPVVMGRKTWDSLGRPLPGRRNIILSRTLDAGPDREVVRSPSELDALNMAGNVFVIGGAEIYQLLLPRCTAFYLTVLEASHDGDAVLPEFEHAFPNVTVLRRIEGVAEWRLYERAVAAV